MSKDKKQALQDAFLNAVRKEKIDLTIFLKNGVKLQGIVSWFDSFCILLRKNGINQLVYKHAISTIMPSHPFKILDDDSETSQPSTNEDTNEDTNENASLKEEKITEKEE